jgi:phosphoribosylformimino-5-aminoimidazole carboxamide ribotide isomerase
LEELQTLGVYGAIVGKAYYEGKVSLEELAQFEVN